jgi:hypothetical protein
LPAEHFIDLVTSFPRFVVTPGVGTRWWKMVLLDARGDHDAKPVFVVEVIGLIVVAVGHPDIPFIIVPRAAPQRPSIRPQPNGDGGRMNSEF